MRCSPVPLFPILCTALSLLVVGCGRQDGEESSSPAPMMSAQQPADSSTTEAAAVPRAAASRVVEAAGGPPAPAEAHPFDESSEPLDYLPVPAMDLPEEVMQGLHGEQDDALRSAETQAIWETWDDVLHRNNPQEVSLTAAALGDSLRTQTNARVYSQIEQRLFDPASSLEERLGLIEVLRFAATPQSARILLELIGAPGAVDGNETNSEDALYLSDQARDAVATLVRTPVDDAPNWSVSSALESAWNRFTEVGTDADLHLVAEGLAVLGTDSGTRTLIDAARLPPGDSPDPVPIEAARKALTQLTSIDAVPALQEALLSPDLPGDATETMVRALVSIGHADAGMALVEYLRETQALSDEQVADLGSVLRSREFPEETRKVFRDAIFEQNIEDSRLAELLMDLASEP